MNYRFYAKRSLILTLALFTCFSSISSALTEDEKRMLHLGDTFSISNNNYYRQFRESSYYNGSNGEEDYFVDKYGNLRTKNEYYINDSGQKQLYYDEYFVDSMGNTIYPYKGYYYDKDNKKQSLSNLEGYSFDYYKDKPNTYYSEFIDDIYSKYRYHRSYYFDTYNNLRTVYRNMDKYDYINGYYVENPRYYNNIYSSPNSSTFQDSNYLLYAVSSLPGKFPIGSKDWPDKAHYSANKEKISKNLGKEAKRMQNRYGNNFFEEQFVEAMLRTYFSSVYSSNNTYEDNLTDFMYYFGFSDDFVARYTDNPNDSTAMEVYLRNEGNDLYLLYRDYYHDYVSYYDINKAYDNRNSVEGNFFINPSTNLPYDVYVNNPNYNPNTEYIPYYYRGNNFVPYENYYSYYGPGTNPAYVSQQDIINYERMYNIPYNSNTPIRQISNSQIVLSVGNSAANIHHPYGTVESINLAVAPRLVNNEIYLPIGLISNYLGISLKYNNEDKSTTLSKNTLNIKIYNNSNTIITPGQTVSAPNSTIVVQSRLLVPAGYLQYLGFRFGQNMFISGNTITINK